MNSSASFYYDASANVNNDGRCCASFCFPHVLRMSMGLEGLWIDRARGSGISWRGLMRTKSEIKRMFGVRGPSKRAAASPSRGPWFTVAPGKSSEHFLTAHITDRAN
jgi:hypothetical protein